MLLCLRCHLSSMGPGHGTSEGAAWASGGEFLGLALPWELGRARGAELGAAQGREMGRAVRAAPCLGRWAAWPFSGAVACPALVQETQLWDCCHQEQTSRVSPAVPHRPSSSCLDPPWGAERLQTGLELRVQHPVLPRPCVGPAVPLAAVGRARGARDSPGSRWPAAGSASLGRGQRLQSASDSFLGTCSQ